MKTKKHSITKCLLAFFFTITICQSVNAQKLVWATNTYADGSGAGQIIADDSGNSVVFGQFFGTIELKKGLSLSQVPGQNSGAQYVAGYDKNGICQWAFKQGEYNVSVSLDKMLAGANGDFYFTGSGYKIAINGFTGKDTAIGQFIAKCNKNGQIQWIRKYLNFQQIISEANGNLFISGYVKNDSLNINGTILKTKHDGRIYYYAAVLDSGGNLLKGPSFIASEALEANLGGIPSGGRILGIGTDKSGNTYAGFVSARESFFKGDTVWIDTQMYVLTQSNPIAFNGTGFLLKLDSALHVINKYQIPQGFQPFISMDASGNTYLAAGLSGNHINLGGAILNPDSSKYAYAIAKLDNSFHEQWGTTIIDTSLDYINYFGRIYVDKKGRSYLTISSIPRNQVLDQLYSIVELDANGNQLWRDTILSVGKAQPQNIGLPALYPSNNGLLYFAGTYDTTSTFFPSKLPATRKGTCAYMGALENSDTTHTGISQFSQSTFTCTLFPNPANDILNIRMVSTKIESYSYSIQSMEGKEIGAGKFSAGQGSNNFALPIQSFAKGMYILTLQNNDGSQRMKFLKE